MATKYNGDQAVLTADGDLTASVEYYTEQVSCDVEAEEALLLAAVLGGFDEDTVAEAAALSVNPAHRKAAAQLAGSRDNVAVICGSSDDETALTTAKKTTNCDVADTLSRHNNTEIVEAAAGNPALPQARLTELITGLHGDSVAVAAVANPAATAEQLLAAAETQSVTVRVAVATTPNGTHEVHSGLVGDSSCAVREALAGNTSVDEKLLAILGEDTDLCVMQTAMTTLTELRKSTATEHTVTTIVITVGDTQDDQNLSPEDESEASSQQYATAR